MPSPFILPHEAARSSRIKTIDIRYPRDLLLDPQYVLALIAIYNHVEHLYLSAGGINSYHLDRISDAANNWVPTLKTLALRFFEDVGAVHCLLRCLPLNIHTRIDIHVEILDRARAWDIDGLSVFLGISMLNLDPYRSANWISISQRSLSMRDRDETPHVQLQLGHKCLDLVGVDPFLTITKDDPHLRCLSQTFSELSGIISARSTISILRIELEEPIQLRDLLRALLSLTNLVSLTVVLSHHGGVREPYAWVESASRVVLRHLQDLTLIASGPTEEDALNQCAAHDRLLSRITFPVTAKVNRLVADTMFDSSGILKL
ncbi:uncharacterized protein STEHIDRAFT_162666 [Stereum hirsutum FP-91666 SS1]|uniref:uncharacterized protein n=1 Tax=Stereum hirsutum (strain FP-91666) TaxID=721885 RepID=UPI0004449B0C|nr:uncharacterized protein STEHIDRAFT_162666 [Stereum hirsutum FP-91666 SS1]EIM80909.1 hypothetical protein STEHIDRAFT_162666 [Stereum hirsutum FP-91666 SS1]